MATDLGTDVSTYVLNDEGEADLDPFFRTVDERRAIAESVMRGFEPLLRNAQNGDFDDADLSTLRARLASTARDDERVASCSVEFSLDRKTRTLRFTAAIESEDGDSLELTGELTEQRIARILGVS